MAEHRIILTQKSLIAPQIALVGASTIGVVVTCPAGAFGSGKAFPDDTAPAATAAAVGTPKYITQRSQLAADSTIGLGATYDGEENTIDAVLDAIYAQGRGLGVWVVPVAIGTGNVADADIVTALKSAIKKLGALYPKPKIIVCPNSLSIITTNAIDSALVTESQNLTGITVIDPPTTLNPTTLTYTLSDGENRSYVVYPGVKATGNANRFASPYVAATIASNDARRGFWTSPSNQVINGIVGTQADISYGFSGSDAVLLNTGKVATILNDDGWRLWGNESYGAQSAYSFINVRRVADAIGESIEKGVKWAIDRNISRDTNEQIAQSVNGFISTLKARARSSMVSVTPIQTQTAKIQSPAVK